MVGLYKLMSTDLLNKSHNKLHGLTLCAIKVFNRIFLGLPHLYPTHGTGENWDWINNIVVAPQYQSIWQSEKKEAWTD